MEELRNLSTASAAPQPGPASEPREAVLRQRSPHGPTAAFRVPLTKSGPLAWAGLFLPPILGERGAIRARATRLELPDSADGYPRLSADAQPETPAPFSPAKLREATDTDGIQEGILASIANGAASRPRSGNGGPC